MPFTTAIMSPLQISRIPTLPTTVTITLPKWREAPDGSPMFTPVRINLRVWIEGSDASAVISNAGTYFAIALTLSVKEEEQ